MKHAFRRRKKFIDSKAQLMIAVEIILHSLLLPIMLAFILFVPPFAGWFSDAPIEKHQEMAYALYDLNTDKWPLLIGIILFIGLVSILFSHHIVGPAYRFKEVLKKLINRDLTCQVRLRKNDYLKDIEDGFNNLILRLRTDIRLTKEKMLQIQRDLDRLAGSAQSMSQNEKNLLKEIREKTKAVHEALSAYKIDEPSEESAETAAANSD